MAINIAPLSWRTPIVNPDDGTPSSFFIRLWQGLFSSKTIVVNSDRQTIKYNSVGTPTPADQTTTFTTIKSDSASTVMWSVTDSNGNNLTPTTTYLSVEEGDETVMTRAQFDAAIAANSTVGVKVIATVTDGGKSFSAFAAVNKVSDGSAGAEGPPGPTGPAGSNSAVVYAYQRGTSSPTLPSDSVTYTFATASSTGLNNGWTSTIPSGANPLYVTAASASGAGATDVIAPGEWATPVIVSSSGVDGLNAATVFLYKRATPSPAVPSSSLTYTFSTGVLSGTLDGWTQAVPTGTDTIYLTTATAVSSSSTDTILTGEWATPRILAANGIDALTSANLVRYSDFALGLKGWGFGVGGGTVVSGFPATGTFQGKTFLKLQGESFSGVSRFMVLAQTSDAYFPVVAGERYGVSAKIESQNGGGVIANNYLRVRWYDDTRALISEGEAQVLSGPQAYGTLMSGFLTAPAGAIYGAIAFYTDTVTAGLISMVIYEPSVAAVSASTTVLPVYVPGQNDPLADQTSVNNSAGFIGEGALARLNTTSATTISANSVTNYTVTSAANPTFNSGTSPTALSYTLSKPSDTYLVNVTVTGTMKITGTFGTPGTNLQVYGRANGGVTIFGRLDVNENVSGTTIYRQFNFTNSYPAASLTNGQNIDIYAVLSSSGGDYDVQFLYTQIVVTFFKR